jgi:putative ABC transport system ATP-binding protein
MVGLTDKATKYPKQLSGGQQQRVAIARAVINEPKFIIADEPTGALDTHTSEEIMKLFVQLNQEKKATIILVTHDPEMIPYCTRLIQIRDGAIMEDKELNR